MLYFKNDSNYTVVFSDKHYREQAIETLDKFRDTVIFDERNVWSVLHAYKDQNDPPFLQLNVEDVRRRCKCFEYGVKIDASGEKWEAAKREQVNIIADDSKQVDISGTTMQELFPNIVDSPEKRQAYDTVLQYIMDNIFPATKENFNKAAEILEKSREIWVQRGKKIVEGLMNFKDEEDAVDKEIERQYALDYLQQYVIDCCRTECEYSDATMRMTEYADLLHGSMGVMTESGELLDAVKKFIFYGKDLDVVNIEEEIGDIMWYIAIICKSLKLDLQTILEKNISKLKKRYPEKFTEDKALNRDLNAERSILEERN